MKPCRYCGKKYKDVGVWVHEMACSLNPNPNLRIVCSCLKCGHGLSKNNIRKHVEACTRSPVMLVCPQCGIEFEKKYGVTCSYLCANKYFKDKQQIARTISIRGTSGIPTDEELFSKDRIGTGIYVLDIMIRNA